MCVFQTQVEVKKQDNKYVVLTIILLLPCYVDLPDIYIYIYIVCVFQTQVEVKKQDNKYVVLTFIFVGCTAGVLLAVVVIYVVRKHARSKEKLAQLSATGQGTEASKDYQVCGQT